MLLWNETDLDLEQQAAILEEGSVFLAACPGSGKTRTLTYKVAYELSRLVSDKEYVAAITYTNRAADEIHDRIERLGVGTSNLWIGTIHSFCLEWIIKPYSIYHNVLSSGFRVIDTYESDEIIDKLCLEISNPKITRWDCGYYYDDTGRHLSCNVTGKHNNINAVLDRYERILNENNQIDFNQILLYSYQLLQSNPAIIDILSKIFPYVLVDEYQDTQRIQYLIISSIINSTSGNTEIFIVGDPNQAIYNSLGGYPIDIKEFQTMCGKELKSLFLNKNYRSSEKIVNYFSNFSLTNVSVVPSSKLINFESLITHDTKISKDDLLSRIVELIRFSVEDLKIKQDEICIVAPQWVHLTTITRRLVANMPEYEFNGPGMVPFAGNRENFWYIFAKIALTDSSPDLYFRRLRWAGHVLEELSLAGVDTSNLSKKSFLKECNRVSLVVSDGLDYLRNFFEVVMNQLNIDINIYATLKEHHTAFFEGSRKKISLLLKEDPSFQTDLETFKKVFRGKSGVTISTIHGVKGSEFDVVIAFALLEGMVPHFSDSQDSASRLLYVVGSRAKKNLHLISEEGRIDSFTRQSRIPTVRLTACNHTYD